MDAATNESSTVTEAIEPLGLRDLFGFLIGRRHSIERVAAQPFSAILCGLFGVVVAGLCREYDQELFSEKQMIFFLPLLASLLMGTWLYAVFCTVSPSGKRQHSWLVFMGLFWMTAPCAWLYALPVERFCPDSLTAIKVNFALLGIVATWRVLLMGRVISVLTGNPGTAILLVGSGVIVVPLIFLKSLNVAVMVMGGGVHSPEQKFIKDFTGLLGFYLLIGAVLALAFLIWKAMSRNAEECSCLQAGEASVVFSWTLLIPPVLVAAAVATQWPRAQDELAHYHQAMAVLEEWDEPNQPPKRTAEERMDAVDILLKRGLPPGRNLQPPVYLSRFSGVRMERCIKNFLALRPTHSQFLKDEVRITLTRSIELLNDRAFFNFEPGDFDSCKELIKSLPEKDPMRLKLDAKLADYFKQQEETQKQQEAQK